MPGSGSYGMEVSRRDRPDLHHAARSASAEPLPRALARRTTRWYPVGANAGRSGQCCAGPLGVPFTRRCDRMRDHRPEGDRHTGKTPSPHRHHLPVRAGRPPPHPYGHAVLCDAEVSNPMSSSSSWWTPMTSAPRACTSWTGAAMTSSPSTISLPKQVSVDRADRWLLTFLRIDEAEDDIPGVPPGSRDNLECFRAISRTRTRSRSGATPTNVNGLRAGLETGVVISKLARSRWRSYPLSQEAGR